MIQRNILLLFAIAVIISSCDKKPAATQQSISRDEISIRYARDLSNKAIAEKDTMAIDKVWMDDFLIITSSNDLVQGKAENRKLFLQLFRQRPDVIYERSPLKIEVMEEWKMAAEYGSWEGSWSEGESKIEVGGSYYAKWHKIKGKWLLRTEVFTATHCNGGPYCATSPLEK